MKGKDSYSSCPAVLQLSPGRRQQLLDMDLCGLEHGVMRVTAGHWCCELLGLTDCPPTTLLVMVLKYSLLSCTIKKKDPSLSVLGIFRLLLCKLWET